VTLLTIARSARAAALGIWLGGIIMAFIVAPIVFDALKPDRARAGEIVGSVLHTAGKLKIALAMIAAVAEIMIFTTSATAGEPIGWRRYVPAVFLGLTIVTTLLTTFWLEPKITEIRDRITDFSEATKDTADRMAFRKLHGASMGVLLLEAIFVAVALVAGLL
jgi:hypothetical protein